MPCRNIRRAFALAGIAASGLIIAACGPGNGTGGVPPERPATGQSPGREAAHFRGQATGDAGRHSSAKHAAGADRCRTGQLSARITGVEPAAGNRYAVLVLANESARSCTLSGHPGVLLLGKNRHPLPTDVRYQPPRPRRVVVEPRTSASASLRWGVVAGDGAPVEAEYARITPPDAAGHLRVPFDQRISGGRVNVTSVVDGDDGTAG